MSIRDLKAYEIMKEEDLIGIQAKGYLLRHKKSRARILLIEKDDNNKVFSIGFRTPPSDSTGVPHIMEHSVLCGSKNFPAKDPFVELVKGSLNTFLNAMTYPDKTVYPVASTSTWTLCFIRISTSTRKSSGRRGGVTSWILLRINWNTTVLYIMR